VRDLRVSFSGDGGVVQAVRGVSFDVFPGEVLGIVGESGSGKSTTAMALMGLHRGRGTRTDATSIRLGDLELMGASERDLRRIRGKHISMVFQDPMSSLNPVQTIGVQIVEAIRLHESVSRTAARDRAIDLLSIVGMPSPRARASQYPHEFSGGMRQRAMIAMAIANSPAVIVADEPTTALDVTVQAQVLDVLQTAKQETGAAIILITHDLGVVAEISDRTMVMYAGEIVEQASTADIFKSPRHPYTIGLLGSLPMLNSQSGELLAIPGSPPRLSPPPSGCAFEPRCPLGKGLAVCQRNSPRLQSMNDGQRSAACHFISPGTDPSTFAERASSDC
jgi:oligopeptide/dipeptide ABC transporter ATP-binding protein